MIAMADDSNGRWTDNKVDLTCKGNGNWQHWLIIAVVMIEIVDNLNGWGYQWLLIAIVDDSNRGRW